MGPSDRVPPRPQLYVLANSTVTITTTLRPTVEPRHGVPLAAPSISKRRSQTCQSNDADAATSFSGYWVHVDPPTRLSVKAPGVESALLPMMPRSPGRPQGVVPRFSRRRIVASQPRRRRMSWRSFLLKRSRCWVMRCLLILSARVDSKPQDGHLGRIPCLSLMWRLRSWRRP